MSNPESIRAAAYLATQQRLDAKRRTTKVKCTPPNRQCGNRCIPPDWDCRLKGEGTDPHLAAVGKGSDPVAGLANVERGLSRIGKGVVKFSFSEIEGGRKALARGGAKLAPGDLKRKEDIKKNVDTFLGRVLLPATAIVGAGLMHRGLKNFRGYREGIGLQIDDAARSAINLIRTNIPGYGEAVRGRQRVGPEAVAAIGRATTNIQAAGPESLRVNAGQRRTLTGMMRSSTDLPIELSNKLDASLKRVDGGQRVRNVTYNEWHPQSLEAFWKTRRTDSVTPGGAGTDGSIFSVHAANELLARSFGLQRPSGADLKAEGESVISGLRQALTRTGEAVRTSMREAGLNAKDPAAIRLFIGRSGGSSAADNRATQILVRAVEQTNYETQAKALYKDTLAGYDRLFNKIGDDLAQAPSIDIISNRGSASERAQLAKLRQNSFYTDAVEAHSAYLGRRMQLSEPVYGSYTGTIARRAYYSRFVVGKKTTRNQNVSIALTSTEAFNAGIEVARARGLAEPTTPEAALRLVNEAYGTIPGGAQRPNALGEITLIRGTYQSPRSPVVETTTQRPARRRRVSRQELIQRLLRQRDRNGTPVYTPESAATEAERLLALRRQDTRVDVYKIVRLDYTKPTDRKGKPCGKSFVPKQAKCSKPTTSRYKDKPVSPVGSTQAKQSSTSSNLTAKLATAAVGGLALAAGGRLAYRNRAKIKATARKTSIIVRKRARKLKRQTATAYNRAQVIAGVTSINTLSSKQVRQGLDMVPEQWQSQTRNLVGRAKVAAAAMVLKADSSKLVNVDPKNNFSTFQHIGGHYLTVGSSDDSLILFRSHSDTPIDFGGGNKAGKFIMDFQVDLKHDQKSGLTPTQSSKLVRTTKAMFNEQVKQLPDNSFVSVAAHKDDGLGDKRARVYQKWGFRTVPGTNPDEMWAIKREGKFTKIGDDEVEGVGLFLKGAGGQSAAPPRAARDPGPRQTNRAEVVQRLLRQRTSDGKPKYTPESARAEADRILAERRRDTRVDAYLQTRQDFTSSENRKGKPCGKSFVPKKAKCTKPTTARYKKEPSNQSDTRAVQVAAGLAATGAVAALAFAGATRAKVNQYRKNVAKSAIEAEKLAIEFERQFREKAAQRLNKDVKDVTGFEASVFNYKDKGQDRGFAPADNDPAWFGQTPSSKGAVVMLAYADDNKFTKRGQGGYAMAKGGAFQQVWGDRDILPYANNISQPTSSLPDDLQVLSRERIISQAGRVGGEVGRNAAKAGFTIKDTLKRFEFLRKNVNERGFNPDAVRAAAFVAAQRRLTGKSVDIMSYSNGGNVATETLAILNEMGYRDVKVVNIAGPTFGIFKHSPDQMRTWVSKGDDFYKVSGGLAFQGGNTRILKNNNIPHGLTEKIDPNNREYGATAAENRRAKNSYLLDEQLRAEAYKFLNVDRRRASELLDETIWRISTNKPFEGDLDTLYGAQGNTKLLEYKQLLNSGGDRDAVKARILDEIEDRMLDKWYGGYNPTKVKNAQKAIRKELQSQIAQQPTSRSDMYNNVRFIVRSRYSRK